MASSGASGVRAGREDRAGEASMRIGPALSVAQDTDSGTSGKIESGNVESEVVGLTGKPVRPSDKRVEWVRLAVARYERPLTQYAMNILAGDIERARDIVQEAFLRLCDQEPENVESHLAEWLYTVCRNLAIDSKRKDRRMKLISEEQEATFAADHESPNAAAERVDSYSRVVEAMSLLPPRQQEVVRLKFQHGLSYKQIGDVLNLTSTNVGFILHTAIKTLRGHLSVEIE